MPGVRDATRARTAAPADFASSRSNDCGSAIDRRVELRDQPVRCFGRSARIVGQGNKIVREALERSANRLW